MLCICNSILSALCYAILCYAFQGHNHNVRADYCASDFITSGQADGADELTLLAELFARERAAAAGGGGGGGACNVLVDLCGLVKKASVRAVRDLVRAAFGADAFAYVYVPGSFRT